MKLLLLVALLGCNKSTKPDSLGAEGWGSADYAKAGIKVEKPWTVDDLVTATVVLKKQVDDGHRERLPHFHGVKSGTVFDDLIAPAPDDSTAPIVDQFNARLKRGDSFNKLLSLYMPDMLATPPREYIELTSAYLIDAVAMAKDVDPILTFFGGSDDPKHTTRLEGLAKMKKGFGDMLHGSLLISEDKRVPEADRIAMVGAVTRTLPGLYPMLEPEMQSTIRDNIAKHVAEVPSGKEHDAFVAAQHAMP